MVNPGPAGVVVACVCGEVYELRPEYGGRLLECPVCGRRLRAPLPPGVPRLPTPGVDPAFDRDVFLLNERALAIRSRYDVWSDDGKSILHVERPTFPVRTLLAYLLGGFAASIAVGWLAILLAPAGRVLEPVAGIIGLVLAAATFVIVSMSARPVRHVTVYRDDSRAEIVLRVLQDQRVAVLERTYTVITPAGEVLARLRKIYLANLVRKRWDVESASGVRAASAVEDSMVLSLLRRVLGPFFGLLRTNFLILGADGVVIGEFNRKFTLLDRYVLDLRADVDRRLDRRVALAFGVMLDSGERR